MRITIGVLSAFFFIHVQAWGVATVQLNNINPFVPIYIFDHRTTVRELAPTQETMVQLFAGNDPFGPWNTIPVMPVSGNSPVIRLNEPGLFDAGIGIIPGIVDSSSVYMTLVATTGSTNWREASSFAMVTWVQTTGSWDGQSQPISSAPSLNLHDPPGITMNYVPEPTTWALLTVGLIVMFWKGKGQ